MNIELLSVNGKIVSKRVYEIGQDMGLTECDTLARDAKYQCKTYDDEYGVEHQVLVQYDPNVVAGRVKGVIVGVFKKNNKTYSVSLMEDATYCVMTSENSGKFYHQVSDKVKDIQIKSSESGIKVMCKPLYSHNVQELKLRDFKPKSTLAM